MKRRVTTPAATASPTRKRRSLGTTTTVTTNNNTARDDKNLQSRPVSQLQQQQKQPPPPQQRGPMVPRRRKGANCDDEVSSVLVTPSLADGDDWTASHGGGDRRRSRRAHGQYQQQTEQPFCPFCGRPSANHNCPYDKNNNNNKYRNGGGSSSSPTRKLRERESRHSVSNSSPYPQEVNVESRPTRQQLFTTGGQRLKNKQQGDELQQQQQQQSQQLRSKQGNLCQHCGMPQSKGHVCRVATPGRTTRTIESHSQRGLEPPPDQMQDERLAVTAAATAAGTEPWTEVMVASHLLYDELYQHTVVQLERQQQVPQDIVTVWKEFATQWAHAVYQESDRQNELVVENVRLVQECNQRKEQVQRARMELVLPRRTELRKLTAETVALQQELQELQQATARRQSASKFLHLLDQQEADSS